MSVRIRWEGRGVCVRYDGIVSVADIEKASIAVQADERWSDVRYVLEDFLRCTGIDPTAGSVEALAAADFGARISNPHVCVALVTRHDEVRALIDKYLALGVETFPHAVFSNLGEAEAWVESFLFKHTNVPNTSLFRLDP